MENIEALLKKVGEIVKRYEEEDRKTGRKFNVYSIAGIERDEVKTHSRMIAELLDPKGSHGQGDLFLKLFLERFLEKSEIENTDKVQVYVETNYGNNGRVDIEIILNNRYIIIENKIDAGDQPEQLKRYSDIAENVKKYAKDKYSLLYLTKYGREPSEESLKSNTSNNSIQRVPNGTNEDSATWKKGDEYIDLRLISYREDIRNWIEECIKQSVFIPNIRDGLTQYLSLVKRITGVEKTFIKEHLVELLFKDQKNLEYAREIIVVCDTNEFKGKLLFNFLKKLEESLEKKYELIKIEDISSESQQYLFEKVKDDTDICVAWFSNNRDTTGIKEKQEWERKGFFMRTCDENLFLHIEVATKALHYGLVWGEKDKKGKFIFGERAEKLDEAIEKMILCRLEKRDWNQKWGFYWYSKYKDELISKFDTKVMQFLINDADDYANEIVNQVGFCKQA